MKVFVIDQAQLIRYALLTLAAVVLSFLLGFLSALQFAILQPSEVSGLQLSQEAEQTDETQAESTDSTPPAADSTEEPTEAETAAEAEKKSQPEVTTEQKTTQQKPEPRPTPPAAKASPPPAKKPSQPVTASDTAETTSAEQSRAASNQRVYSIQAGMFASKTNAQSFIDKLSEKDFAAYVAEFVSSDGAVKYNVRVGHFSSREQARERLKQYQQLFASPAYVVIAQ